jgi:hypothetical protein
MKDNLNPDFSKGISCNYNFEMSQEIKIELRDDDGSGDYELIGNLEVLLGTVAGSPN